MNANALGNEDGLGGGVIVETKVKLDEQGLTLLVSGNNEISDARYNPSRCRTIGPRAWLSIVSHQELPRRQLQYRSLSCHFSDRFGRPHDNGSIDNILTNQ